VLIDSEVVELRHKWKLGLEIAEGGFGVIYAAQDEQGTQAVVKFVLKMPSASRELLFESLPSHPNIIPIWETGE
jgi:serine/threonine protein kinase